MPLAGEEMIPRRDSALAQPAQPGPAAALVPPAIDPECASL